MEQLDRARRSLAIALAALAGFVDGSGFLLAGGYFVSFMSGNTTRLAVNLAHEPALALTPILLIAGFVSGVAAGAVLAERAGRWRKAAVLSLVTSVLVVAALCANAGWVAACLAALVFAMGALNNTFRRNGEVAFGLTYMTGSLVRLGQGIAARVTGESRSDWVPYLQLWLGLAIGGIAGALSYLTVGPWTLWVAAACALLLTGAATRLAPLAEA